MNFFNFFSISPLDGRYFDKVKKLSNIFSEFNFFLQRIKIEIMWLQSLSLIGFKEIKPFSKKNNLFLKNIIKNFNFYEFKKIKYIEKKIKHDIKSIEYWLKYKFKKNYKLKRISEFIHFTCTSEDINNIAYALMIKKFKENIFLPKILILINKLKKISYKYSNISILSRTHGQLATPTTFGKEISNFIFRLTKIIKYIKNIKIICKINGSVGNYNSNYIVYPKFNWIKFNRYFIEKKLNIFLNLYTTQIEPHDYICEIFYKIFHINNILINFNRDIWGYISLDYFKQKFKKREVGSSIMPHKINPINFENSEGNLGISNSLLNHFMHKLPISRWQRDLSDSTVLRNIGLSLGYSLVAYNNIIYGLNKLKINKKKIKNDLLKSWKILSEPIQTVMRRYNILNSYEKLKNFSRKKISKKKFKKFILNLNLPKKVKKKLFFLKSKNYIGKANKLTLKLLNIF